MTWLRLQNARGELWNTRYSDHHKNAHINVYFYEVMRMSPRMWRISAAIIAKSALAGCGANTGPGSPSAAPSAAETIASTRNEVRPEVVRGSKQWDFEPFQGLTDAVLGVEVAATGMVMNWSEGRSIHDLGDVERFAILAIKVDGDAKIRGIPASAKINVAVCPGLEALDAQGNPIRNLGQGSTVRTVQELEAAVPIGTRLIFLGDPTPSVEVKEYAPGVVMEDAQAGLPAGAASMTPYLQGLLLETATGGYTGGLALDDDVAFCAAEAAAAIGVPNTTMTSPGSFENLRSELYQSVLTASP